MGIIGSVRRLHSPDSLCAASLFLCLLNNFAKANAGTRLLGALGKSQPSYSLMVHWRLLLPSLLVFQGSAQSSESSDEYEPHLISSIPDAEFFFFFCQNDAMWEIFGGPLKKFSIAFSHHLENNNNTWRLQANPGRLVFGLTLKQPQTISICKRF